MLSLESGGRIYISFIPPFHFFFFYIFPWVMHRLIHNSNGFFSHESLSFPQFKKVFSLLVKRMHTACAERFLAENFARCSELQSGLSGRSWLTGKWNAKRKPAWRAGFRNMVFQQLFVFVFFFLWLRFVHRFWMSILLSNILLWCLQLCIVPALRLIISVQLRMII